MFWAGYSPPSYIAQLTNRLSQRSAFFGRLSDYFPEASLWGSKGIDYLDANQGGGATCYIITAMSGLASNKGVVERLFVNKQKSSNGIYGVNLFIRGKPWTVVVDDIFLIDQGRNLFKNSLEYA